jgi:hypothetical protein
MRGEAVDLWARLGAVRYIAFRDDRDAATRLLCATPGVPENSIRETNWTPEEKTG